MRTSSRVQADKSALVANEVRKRLMAGDVNKDEIGKMKVGRYMIVDGEACQIVNMQKSAPGKHGHAKYRIDVVNLLTGSKKNIVLTGHAKVDVPVIEKKPAQVLSVAGNTASVMDMASYETFDLEIPEDLQGKVNEGGEVVYWNITGTKVMKEVRK